VKLLDLRINKLGRKKNPARSFFSASGA